MQAWGIEYTALGAKGRRSPSPRGRRAASLYEVQGWRRESQVAGKHLRTGAWGGTQALGVGTEMRELHPEGPRDLSWVCTRACVCSRSGWSLSGIECGGSGQLAGPLWRCLGSFQRDPEVAPAWVGLEGWEVGVGTEAGWEGKRGVALGSGLRLQLSQRSHA